MGKLFRRIAEVLGADRARNIRTPQDLTQACRELHNPTVKSQAHKRQTRYTYTDGPVYFIGQQIVKGMEDAGFPSKIHTCYRSPEAQADAKRRKVSKAGPYQSPHQYYEAVDIIHASLGWIVPQEYWDTLRDVAQIVADKYGVTLEYGYDWGWDSAHIELKDWRKVRAEVGKNVPTSDQRWDRFKEVLPQIARDYQRRQEAKGKPCSGTQAGQEK